MHEPMLTPTERDLLLNTLKTAAEGCREEAGEAREPYRSALLDSARKYTALRDKLELYAYILLTDSEGPY